jgi:hypothetical protein
MNTIKHAALVLTASVFVNVVLACGSDGLTFGGKGASAADGGGGSAEATVVVATCDQQSDGKYYAEAIFGDRTADELVAVRVGVTSSNGSAMFSNYPMRVAVEVYVNDQRVAAVCEHGATATFVLP